MTFDEFKSNDEQMEAHFEAYKKLWNNGCAAALLDTFPELTLDDLLWLRGEGWECYLTDTHLEIQLRTAPPEYREAFQAITPNYIVNYLVRCLGGSRFVG